MNTPPIAAPYEDTLVVKPEWLDASGHMNVAFYVRAFDDGGELFFRACGIGWDYTRLGEYSIFMINCDLDFRRELFENDPLRITTQLIDWSPKLLHTYQALYHRDDEYLAATAEMLFLHVAFSDRRGIEMSDETQATLAAVAAAHQDLPRPDNLGRKIEIRR
jgi:acyl-CoA thioester hydrolase